MNKTNKQEDKKKKRRSKLEPCKENTLITQDGKIKQDTGLTENAKIIME